MKHPFYISLLLGCLCGLAACTGPVIIEEEEDDKNGGTHVRDSVPIIHEGTYTSPYSIAEAQTLGRGKSVWIEGYIVGCVKGSMKNGCNFTANASTTANILLADTFLTGSENDYLYCIPIELSNGSLERDELNLYDHPDNFHRKVRIEGDLTLYYSVVGIKGVTYYTFGEEYDNDYEDDGNSDSDDDDKEDENEEKEPDTPYDPDATRKDTLTIAEGIKIQKRGDYEHVYIKGYIIGYTTTKQKVYYDLSKIGETKKTAKTNVILADNIEERDIYNMIAVELKGDSYIQQAINLVDNPQNLHKCLTVKGGMKEYKGLYGCIDVPNGKEEPNGSGNIIEGYYFLLE